MLKNSLESIFSKEARPDTRLDIPEFNNGSEEDNKKVKAVWSQILM